MRIQTLFLFSLALLLPVSLKAEEKEEKAKIVIHLSTDHPTSKLSRVAVRLVNEQEETRFFSQRRKEWESADDLRQVFLSNVTPGDYSIEILLPLGLDSVHPMEKYIHVAAGDKVTFDLPLKVKEIEPPLFLASIDQELERKKLLEKRLQEERLEKKREERRLEEKRLEQKRLQKELEEKRSADNLLWGELIIHSGFAPFRCTCTHTLSKHTYSFTSKEFSKKVSLPEGRYTVSIIHNETQEELFSQEADVEAFQTHSVRLSLVRAES
jgi:hypothetical protein